MHDPEQYWRSHLALFDAIARCRAGFAASLFFSLIACASAASPSTPPITVGSEKQLFIDGRFIEKREGVGLTVNRPRVTEEKLVAREHPWEEFFIGAYISVLQDADRIHLWYETADNRTLKDQRGVAYAFSTDGGANWTKPKLGLIDYLGGIISRAIYRLDGFMSMDAGYDQGEFTTPLIVFDSERLELNFDGSAGGWAQVEIQDRDGKAVPGFAAADVEKVVGNAVARTVAWAGKTDLSALRGQPVRIRFILRDAKLYAFQFARAKG